MSQGEIFRSREEKKKKSGVLDPILGSAGYDFGDANALQLSELVHDSDYVASYPEHKPDRHQHSSDRRC
jgi:5-deoxy-D-glucuronate isomerase